MFNKYWWFIGFLLIGGELAAQDYGNSWIDYSQRYWKFQVTGEGLYHITQDVLQAGGFPVNTVDPRKIQVFSREKEIPVRIAGEEDGQFDQDDFIELRALGSDAWLDSLFYDDPAHVPNPYFCLFNDTATYFITYNQSLNNLRTAYSSLTDYENYTPSPWCWFTSTGSYTDYYFIGKQATSGIALPAYEEGEGWFDLGFGMGEVWSRNIPTPQAVTGSGIPAAEVNTVSTSASQANAINGYNHHLQIGYGDPFVLKEDLLFTGIQLNKVNFQIPPEELGTTTRITHKSINDIGVATDYNAVGLIQISYARTYDFAGESRVRFTVKDLYDENAAFVTISGFPVEGARLFIPDLGMKREIAVTVEGDQIKALIPFNGQDEVVVELIAGTEIAEVNSVLPVSQNGYFTDYASQPLDSAFLIITHPKLWTAAENYANYRSGNGDMDVLVADIEQLYMQYGGGIWKHPMAIRRFCDQLVHTWPSKPSHLFLIGKSIYEMRLTGQEGSRNDEAYYARNLVPTMGYPASDLALTSGLLGNNVAYAIPTGRLAAENETQVLEYLNKVVQQEIQTPQAWQKNILHFGGGSESVEQGIFASNLEGYKNIAQDTCFGAKVYTFLKSSTDPIEISLSDSIQMLIEQGVSLMTFFGHASSTGFDQNLDSPLNYNNLDKYPLLIGNSCYTGNIHLPVSMSASEVFTLVPEHGVIGFLAKSDLGSAAYLDLYTRNFYRRIFQKNYGATVGQCMLLATQDVLDPLSPGEQFMKDNVVLTFALHGDPAIRLYPWEKTDYSVSESSLFFDPAEVNAQVDSFDVNVVVNNIGKAVNKPVSVDVIRHFPDGSDTLYTKVFSKILNSDTAVFTMPALGLNAAGTNVFDANVDYPSNLVEELDEFGNNIIQGKNLLITSGDLFPVYPYEYAIVPFPDVSLWGCTGYPFELSKTYVLEVDTTDTFDSPFMQSTQITQSGGAMHWDLPFSCTENEVYFWRCSSDSIDAQNGYRWHESSFQYIPGKEGWGQAHFFQEKHNALARIDYNREQRKLDYASGTVELGCELYGDPQNYYETLATRWMIDLEVQEYSACTTPAILVAVVDSITLEAWESNATGSHPENDFGNYTGCGEFSSTAEKYFLFRQDVESEMLALQEMLTEHIPPGSHVLVYTWRDVHYDQWEQYNPALFDLFDQLGAQQIGTGADGMPFILYYQAGHANSVQEMYGSEPNQFLDMSVNITGTPGAGQMMSTVVGPSLQWYFANWSLSSLDEVSGDTTTISVYGITPEGQEIFISSWPDEPEDISNLAAVVSSAEQVNATEFHQLRISAALTDYTNLTPPQVDAWHIYDEEAPECALNPNLGFYFPQDTVQEGELLSVAIAIQNISTTNMDSLLVSYSVEDEDHVLHPVNYVRQAPLLINMTLLDTVLIPTSGLEGHNILRIEANPINPTTGFFDQTEQYHFNNLAQLPFGVISDNINPLLDVTFDGVRILNGDIVSAEPLIVITLDDENPYFILDEEKDTSHFKLYITTPEIYQQPVYFSQVEVMEWIPATAPANKFRINFTPVFTVDGRYNLLVQASDKSGNVSGDYDYRIDFEVVTRPTITEVLNYPNPFTTQTQFVFTLTGIEVPDEIKIQIMTVGGHVVREITQDELGPIHIGRNQTEYRWNGTDEFGDRLANGVYLYRVMARLNGEELDLRPSGADPYFTKGFGKMYLMR